MQRKQPIIDVDYTVLNDSPVAADGRPPGQALVPPAPLRSERLLHACIRPDASFIAHLIAAAANSPQTRALRRASTEDALASYQGATERRQDNLHVVGRRASLVA